MDILLIQPPIRDFYLTAKRTIPYGLSSIGASLKLAGFSVGILDCLSTGKSKPLSLPPEMSYLDEYYGKPDISPFCLFHKFRHFGYSFQHLENQIRKSNAFLVGISSLFSAYASEAEKTANLVRRVLPDAVIVVGGHHPTALPEDVMKWTSVDYVIRGEGEFALPLLAKAVSHQEDCSQVPGIVFRNPDGSLFVSKPSIIKNLNAVPLPDRSLIDSSFYSRGKNPSTVVVASRGCPRHCSYCAFGNHDLYPYRQRSVQSVMEELTDAVDNFGARFIDFEDENLSLNKNWFLTLLKEISRSFGSGKVELRAMNGLYPPSLDEELIVAMKNAGFRTLNLSLGTTCPVQANRFRRSSVLNAFENCLSHAEKHQLDAVGYIICGAPFQEPAGSVGDLLYLSRQRVLAGMSVFYPAPGSQDYETCRRMGILPEPLSLFRSSALPLSHTTSRIESLTLMRLSRIINFMKSIVDRRVQIPDPGPITSKTLPRDLDRFHIGLVLLKGFLFDGHIRGVMPDGTLYRHSADRNMIHRFLRTWKNG